MTRDLKLLIILLGIVVAAVCSNRYSVAVSASDPTSLPVQDQQTQRELTPQEKRGKAFYLRSETSSGREITALLGDIDVPASTLTCAGCHGARGEGKTEGGVTAGNLNWSSLTKPYGHSDDGGRKHPAFTEASFIRALTSGLDPAGNKMAVAMPIYRLTQQEMADLIAYLKRIETDRDPGLTETTLVLGTVVPDKGPLADLGQAMREVLQAYFAEINSRGGIYNRRIELRIATGDATSTIANTKLLIEESHVFAMVGGVTAGADEALATLSQQSEVPFVGPSTLLPQQNSPLNRYVFYLFAGLHEQARALANFAAKRMDRQTSRVAILCPDAALNKQIAAGIEDQGKKRGWNIVGVYYPRERLDAAQKVASLKQQGVDTVFFLGSAAEARALFKDADTANWTPSILFLGSLVGREITDAVPMKMTDKIFLAFPTVPADVSDAGAQEYGALAEKYKITSSVHTAARLSAFAAAKILVEALKLAGKDLSRERLVTTLEGLYEFETGLTPKITFGPNRRIGALGAYVVTIDPEKKLFPAKAEWISVE